MFVALLQSLQMGQQTFQITFQFGVSLLNLTIVVHIHLAFPQTFLLLLVKIASLKSLGSHHGLYLTILELTPLQLLLLHNYVPLERFSKGLKGSSSLSQPIFACSQFSTFTLPLLHLTFKVQIVVLHLHIQVVLSSDLLLQLLLPSIEGNNNPFPFFQLLTTLENLTFHATHSLLPLLDLIQQLSFMIQVFSLLGTMGITLTHKKLVGYRQFVSNHIQLTHFLLKRP